MELLTSIPAMRSWSAAVRRGGGRIALVPTMGFFHAGHLALMDRARSLADRVVVSLFVNPLQFGPAEDLDRYPRDLQRDRRLAADRGVDVLFAPAVAEMYPPGEGAGVRIAVGPLAERLCGASRPGHFDGVATVVAKLFHIVTPEVAVFGEKDFQQLVIIRRMAADLDFPVSIVGHPVVREPDGLAMSSRNTYLAPGERRRAAAICRGLRRARELVAGGERRVAALTGKVEEVLAAGGLRCEYVAVVDSATLDPQEEVTQTSRLLVAAWAGTTRLIDNCALMPGQEEPVP